MTRRMPSNPLLMSNNCLEIYLYLKEHVRQWIHTRFITDPRPHGLGIDHDTERYSDLRHKHGMTIESDRNEHIRLVKEPKLTRGQIKYIWDEALFRGYMSLASRCEAKLKEDEFINQVSKELI